MTKEERNQKWNQCITDSKHLERSAKRTDSYVWYMANALTLTLEQMQEDDQNDELRLEDEEDLSALLTKIKAYGVRRNGQTMKIAFTAEYNEISKLLKEMEVIRK